MEMSDDEEEDGQISKFDEEEEKERALDKSKSDDGPITVDDLMKAQLTRDILAKHWRKPWFEDLIKGLSSSLHEFTCSDGLAPQVAGCAIAALMTRSERLLYTGFAKLFVG